MLTQNIPTAKFILHELDESLSAQLCKAAADSGLAFYPSSSTAECLALAKRLHADGVFCSSEPGECRKLFTRMKGKGLHMPIVVVSRIPEVSEWLSAIEAGATDFIVKPFRGEDVLAVVKKVLGE